MKMKTIFLFGRETDYFDMREKNTKMGNQMMIHG